MILCVCLLVHTIWEVLGVAGFAGLANYQLTASLRIEAEPLTIQVGGGLEFGGYGCARDKPLIIMMVAYGGSRQVLA